MKGGKFWLVMVLVSACAAVFAVPVMAADDEAANKQVVVEARKIKNDAQPFEVKLDTAEKKEEYKVGDELSLFFTADKECYLYLIDIGTSGKAHILFPNKFQKANKAEKGRIYVLPPKGSKFMFKVQGPEGTNYIKAIATQKPIEALKEGETPKDGPFAELADPAATFKDIGVELKKREPKNWAEAELSIKVVK